VSNLSGVRLGRAADDSRDHNNFDLLRLLAALSVLFGHSFDLLGHDEPFPRLRYVDWGYVGVLIFFSISGFLVARSWLRRPQLLSFGSKRILRLIPGLVVALLLSAVMLGPIVTVEPVHTYFQDPTTKAYVLNNALMQSDYVLPGVFVHAADPSVVNGSLWTLPLEVKGYVLIAVLGLIGALSRRRWVLPPLAVLAAAATINSLASASSVLRHLVAFLVDVQMPPDIVARVGPGDVLALYPNMLTAFIVGAVLYAYREYVVLRWDVAAACAAAIVVACLIGGQVPMEVIAIVGPYCIVCVAYLTTRFVTRPRWLGDYSYGVYIYGFVVQQTITLAITLHSGWVLFALSTPVTLACAALSWRFVERPALGLKRRLIGGEAPAGATA
jgi:peptidoglycan/LPS O-acetylase OafA/YrhL